MQSLVADIGSLSLEWVLVQEEDGRSPRMIDLDDDAIRCMFVHMSVADCLQLEAVCSRFSRLSKEVKALTSRLEAMKFAFESRILPILKREGRGTSNRHLMTTVSPFLFPTCAYPLPLYRWRLSVGRI